MGMVFGSGGACLSRGGRDNTNSRDVYQEIEAYNFSGGSRGGSEASASPQLTPEESRIAQCSIRPLLLISCLCQASGEVVRAVQSLYEGRKR